MVSDLSGLWAAGEGKTACRWGRPAAPTCKRTSLSQQMDARTRCDSELGEGRVRVDELIDLKNWK